MSDFCVFRFGNVDDSLDEFLKRQKKAQEEQKKKKHNVRQNSYFLCLFTLFFCLKQFSLARSGEFRHRYHMEISPRNGQREGGTNCSTLGKVCSSRICNILTALTFL